jgi:hypothetical protein
MADRVDLVFTKTIEITERLRKLKGATIQHAANALHTEHELIMTAAKKITPVEFGTLKGSGHVVPVAITNRAVISEGGFGGAAEDYAIIVHERLTSKSSGRPIQYSVPGTGPKFYETPWVKAIPRMEDRLAKRIKRVLARENFAR